MLVVSEAARRFDDRDASEWHLDPSGPRTHYTDDRPVHRPSRQGAAIGHWLSRVVASINQARKRRELIRVLSAMNDRLLADIGITRNQIRDVADGAARRGPQHASRLVSPTARVHHDAVAVEAVANDDETRIGA